MPEIDWTTPTSTGFSDWMEQDERTGPAPEPTIRPRWPSRSAGPTRRPKSAAASMAVSRALGYRDNGRYLAARGGKPEAAARFALTVEQRRARRDALPWTRTVGLPPCLPMFGLDAASPHDGVRRRRRPPPTAGRAAV
jgi:hypothetical protein